MKRAEPMKEYQLRVRKQIVPEKVAKKSSKKQKATDSYRINAFIMYAALSETPVFDSYKNLCQLEKNQEIDYVDFEWRYYQFYYGNRDLTIERSPANSSPLTLFDMPLHVLEKVVEKVPIHSCMALRKVSRDLQKLADSSSVCKEVKFQFGDTYSNLVLEGSRVYYGAGRYGDCTISRGDEEYKDSRAFYEAMIANASTFLKNPKLRIGVLKFAIDDETPFFEFLKFLQLLNFQLNVRSLIISGNQNEIVPILRLMKPKTLECIAFECLTVEQFDAIAEMEQWKGAKEMVWIGSPSKVPIERMLHFKRVEIVRFNFTEENLVLLRDGLLKSANFESCDLPVWSVDSKENEKRVHTIMGQDPAYDRRARRVSIPNSSDYFQLKFGRNSRGYFDGLTINKISKK